MGLDTASWDIIEAKIVVGRVNIINLIDDRMETIDAGIVVGKQSEVEVEAVGIKGLDQAITN